MKANVYEMVDFLLKREIMSPQMGDYIRQIQKLSSKGVHGETLGEEIMQSIRSIYPMVISYLQEIESKEINESDDYFVSCPRCGYQGFAKYDDECPGCGSVLYDY